MSKNLSFVKNQLFAHFLQPKKMSKNLSSGFTLGKSDTYDTVIPDAKFFFAELQHFPNLICTNSVKTKERT